jgi:integrase
LQASGLGAIGTLNITQLLKANLKPRKQKGQRFETERAFFLRFYHTAEDGQRKQKAVLLAYKSDQYRSWADVEPLINGELARINEETVESLATGRWTLTKFVENDYLKWCDSNKAAPTAYSYRRVWEAFWKEHVGNVTLTQLQTAHVTAVLTQHAKDGKSSRTLSHIKWMLSGVYVFAIARGIVPKNPVPEAEWLLRVQRSKPQTVYSLETVLTMLRVLEPLDLRAAVAVALAYFAALRPAEIRGLQWTDYDGAELRVQRTVWKNKVGDTKTAESASAVSVIEPLRSLLEKLREQSADGHILLNSAGNPLSLDSMNIRIITPALEKAGIEWRGFYPCRRGISSLVTDTSKNALNSTGLLRHSTPITALKHYTRAQKESVDAALETVEKMAAEIIEKQKNGLVQ